MPVLTLDTGVGYFQAFCTRRVCRRYEDTVHFAFSSAHSVIPDKTTTPLHSRADFVPVTTDTEFTLGQDVMYTDGKGLQAKMVNEGATPDGLWHTLRWDDGSKVVTPPSHVHFLDQPDFSNIPSTLLDYRNEVGIGISKEDTQELAYPHILSPSQQILLSWHHAYIIFLLLGCFSLCDGRSSLDLSSDVRQNNPCALPASLVKRIAAHCV